MTIYLPPLIGMARVSLNVSPSQNRLWPWFDVDHLPRSIQWKIGWPRPRPELRVRYLAVTFASFQFHLQDSDHLPFEPF